MPLNLQIFQGEAFSPSLKVELTVFWIEKRVAEGFVAFENLKLKKQKEEEEEEEEEKSEPGSFQTEAGTERKSLG